MSFIRHVPKFLQAHSHLLAKPQSEDDPTVAEPGAVRVEPADDAKEQLDEEEVRPPRPRQAWVVGAWMPRAAPPPA